MTAPASSALRPIQEQIEQANASGRTPVVFIHGLWLLASSGDRWAGYFARAGYAPLTYEQFRCSFANAVDEDQTRRLFDTFAVPAPGAPLWQAATANFNPRTR